MVSERRVLHKQGPEGPTRHKRSRSRPQRKSFQTKHVPRLWKNGWQRSWTYEPYAVPLVAEQGDIHSQHPLELAVTSEAVRLRHGSAYEWAHPCLEVSMAPRCDALGALSMPSFHDTHDSDDEEDIHLGGPYSHHQPSHHPTISHHFQPTYRGAGGYALPLLQKTKIPEIRGFMGFPCLGLEWTMSSPPWKMTWIHGCFLVVFCC